MSEIIYIFNVKEVLRVIDGDSIECLLDHGSGWAQKVSIRLNGLNAAETRTRQVLQKEAGELAKKITNFWVAAHKDKPFYVTSDVDPKFSNRMIGKFLSLESSENLELKFVSLNDFLLNLEVVKPYDGGKREFTEEELQDIVTKAGAFLSSQLPPAV